MPLPAEPTAPAAAPDSEPSPPASLPSTTGSDDKTGDNSPDLSGTSGKKEIVPESIQPAGYSHVDDRPGIAHVTDIPPAGAAKAGGESKKPVVDFIRAMWKPSLKEPAPLQTVQINEMPVVAAVPDALQIQATLQNSLLPSQREMAAEILSNWESHREPTIVPALLRAATEDPAATVRVACATPAYLEEHGIPREPGDLAKHNCLCTGLLPWGDEWRLVGKRGEVRVAVSGNVRSNSAETLRAAVSSRHRHCCPANLGGRRAIAGWRVTTGA